MPDPTDEDSTPLVSVIIPTYGRGDDLSEALDSVCEQTYDNIELFVVDDGSPEPIADALSDRSFDGLTAVTFVRHANNRGANAARNTGIRAATGEYLAFLDDDDRWHREKIARQVETFEKADSSVGVVYTGKQTESPQGTTVMKPTTSGDVVKNLLRGESFGQFSSIMVRAEVVDTAGFPDEQFPAWQDREWLFRLAQHYQFESVPKTLTYRQAGHQDRITANFEDRRDIAYPLFVDKHYALAREHGLYYARTFLATLRQNLGRSAIRANRYREARKYFLLSFLANPLYRPVHAHLIASLGGKWTYETAAFFRRKIMTLQSWVPSIVL